jgi:hypothetical protein
MLDKYRFKICMKSPMLEVEDGSIRVWKINRSEMNVNHVITVYDAAPLGWISSSALISKNITYSRLSIVDQSIEIGSRHYLDYLAEWPGNASVEQLTPMARLGPIKY